MAPVNYPLPAGFRASKQWKIKIQDGELDYEAPHVTVIGRVGGTKRWRINLRTLRIIDESPPKRELPHEIYDHIVATIDQIRADWDEKYPNNQVGDC